MIKKTIEYTNFLGEKKSKTLHFHLSVSDLTKKEIREDGGYFARIQRISDGAKGAEIMATFEEFITDSYGVLEDDGETFDKSEEISKKFLKTAAYDALFTLLVTSSDEASAFVNGIMPPELVAAAQKEADEQGKTIAELARERSEASMQGFKQKEIEPKPDHEASGFQDVPTPSTVSDIPTTPEPEPTMQTTAEPEPEPVVDTSIEESQEAELARLRAQLATRSTPTAQ